MLFDEGGGDTPGASRGVEVAFGCSDDRALHEDVPVVGEFGGLFESGFLGESVDHVTNQREMFDPHLSSDVVRAHLQHDVDEGATLEVGFVKPVVEHVEDRQQTTFRGLCALSRTSLDELSGSAFAASLRNATTRSSLDG